MQLFIVQPLIISVCPRQAQSLKTVIYYAVHSFPFQFIALYTQRLRLRCLSLLHLGARPPHSVTCSISLPSSRRLLKAIKSRRNVFLLCFSSRTDRRTFPLHREAPPACSASGSTCMRGQLPAGLLPFPQPRPYLSPCLGGILRPKWRCRSSDAASEVT